MVSRKLTVTARARSTKAKQIRVDMMLRGRSPLYGLPRNKATLDFGVLMLKLQVAHVQLTCNEVTFTPHCRRIACYRFYNGHNGSFSSSIPGQKFEQ